MRGGAFEDGSCTIPIIFYICLSIIAIVAFPIANSWKWPLIGYASAGLLALIAVCFTELTFLKWIIVSLPIIATIIAIIWIILCRAYDNIVITPTNTGIDINIYEHEKVLPCGCDAGDSCRCDDNVMPYPVMPDPPWRPHRRDMPYPVMPDPPWRPHYWPDDSPIYDHSGNRLN